MGEVRYTIVKRQVYKDGQMVDIYCPKIVTDGTVDTKSISTKGAVAGTLSTVEFSRYAKGLVQIMMMDLLDGKSVKLDKLGIISPMINATMVDTEEACTVDTIVRKSVKYTPSTELKERLKDDVSFRKATNLDVGIHKTTE